MALKKMNRAGDELDAMEKELHDRLHSALHAVLDPEVQVANKFGGSASQLQTKAHSMMDPLYGMGDAAEDKADDLNDKTNDALSAIEIPVRVYRRHITNHASDVQSSVER